MEELISVIVPIYKVEKYLSKCIDTIRRQTYDNLEIILVDDGSPDSCGEICEEYAKKDERIRVIHKENGGLSDARNAGMEAARGNYIMFIDSDDYIHIKMVETLYQTMKKQQAEVAVCGVEIIDEQESGDIRRDISTSEIITISTEEEQLRYFFGETQMIFTVAWNKLYHRDLFQGISYPKGKLHEDEFTTYKLLDRAKRIAYVTSNMYFYVQRKDSIMGIGFNVKRLARLEAYDERMNYYLSQGKLAFYVQVLFYYRLFLLQYMDAIGVAKETDIDILKPFKQRYNEQVKHNMKKCSLSLKEKMSYYLFCYFPGVYYRQYRRKQEAGVYGKQ